MDINDIDLSQLSQDNLKSLLARGIRLIQNPGQGIGTDLFEAIITIVPQPCVETLVVDNLENPQRIYLTWREDQHYHGWHFPGTFIRLGETLEAAIRRVLYQEIDANLDDLRPTNTQYGHVDSRGHTVGTVWLVQTLGIPRGGKWFPIAELPDPTLSHHVEIIQRMFNKSS